VADVATLWTIGEPVPYAALCGVLKKVEGISSRLEMQAVSAFCAVLSSLLCIRSPASVRDAGVFCCVCAAGCLQVLCNLFRSIIALSPDDLLCTVYLCCNRLAPAYVGRELGIGDSILIKAVSAATGRTSADVKAAARKEGDLGVVAEASRGKQATLMRPKPLTVRGVFSESAAAAGKSPSR
jgi:DNA ligase-1